MKTQLDLNSWNRREHFEFFSGFEEPFFGVTANVDCSWLKQDAKDRGDSLFLRYLHAAMRAVNAIPELRLRVQGDQIWRFDPVHASITVARPDKSFGYCFLEFHDDFQIFQERAMAAMERTRQGSGLGLDPQNQRPDVIHVSTLPWISFTSFRHARKYSFPDSVPKILFGGFRFEPDQPEKILLPLSLDLHHGLADGYHAGLFFQLFQEYLDQPARGQK